MSEKIVSKLIDLLEERPCLWDIFDTDYSKREIREPVYTEIAETLDFSVQDIKTKIHNLRAQLGREMDKLKKTQERSKYKPTIQANLGALGKITVFST